MNILRRLTQIESKLKSTTTKKGFMHFYTFDSKTYYHHKTTLTETMVSSISPTKIDYRDCAKGCDGKPDPLDEVFTQEQVQEFIAQGWNCSAIKWVDMSREPNLEF